MITMMITTTEMQRIHMTSREFILLVLTSFDEAGLSTALLQAFSFIFYAIPVSLSREFILLVLTSFDAVGLVSKTADVICCVRQCSYNYLIDALISTSATDDHEHDDHDSEDGVHDHGDG